MNNKMRYFIWALFNTIVTICNFVMLIPAAILKNTLGLLAAIPVLGLLIVLSMSLIWCIILSILITLSWLSKIPIVGFVFALSGMPVIILAYVVFSFMPSFARLRDVNDPNAVSYWQKEILIHSYPFSLEFFKRDFMSNPQTTKIFDHLSNDPILRSFLKQYRDQ